MPMTLPTTGKFISIQVHTKPLNEAPHHYIRWCISKFVELPPNLNMRSVSTAECYDNNNCLSRTLTCKHLHWRRTGSPSRGYGRADSRKSRFRWSCCKGCPRSRCSTRSAASGPPTTQCAPFYKCPPRQSASQTFRRDCRLSICCLWVKGTVN